MKKIVIAIGGASGSIYAKVLLDKLSQIQNQLDAVAVVMSENARFNWKFELGNENYKDYPFPLFDNDDFMAPFASGSAKFDTMIICPCSMGQMGRIAHGLSTDLISRAADVILKERRKLIMVPRDTPLSLIHIKNMELITLAGGIICPASPSFYSKPKDFEALAATVVDRVLDLAGLTIDSFRWGEETKDGRRKAEEDY